MYLDINYGQTRKEAPHLTKDGRGKGKRKLEINTVGSGITFLTPHSFSMSSNVDPLTTKEEETSSMTIVKPRSVAGSATAGRGLSGEVVGVDAGGVSTAQGGEGTVAYRDAVATEVQEAYVMAPWTRETIDSLGGRTEDGKQSHLLARADWSTSLLTVLARARELGRMLGLDPADIAQCETKKIDEDNAAKEKKMQFKITVQNDKLKHFDDGIKMSQKLFDEVKDYVSDTILDADDLETIRQCEISIKESQRQKDAYLAEINPQPGFLCNISIEMDFCDVGGITMCLATAQT